VTNAVEFCFATERNKYRRIRHKLRSTNLRKVLSKIKLSQNTTPTSALRFHALHANYVGV